MAFLKTLVLCLAVVHFCEALEFHIAGDNKSQWQIPSSPDAFNQWAQKNRFQIGDSIAFNYDGSKDSVVEVSEENYKSCTKSNPIKTYNDGKTKITFDKSGLFHFISGADGHCQKGQKLQVRILSATHHKRPTPAPAPTSPIAHDNLVPHHDAPAPNLAPHHDAPAPAPHNGGATLQFGVLGGVAAAVIIALV